MLQTIIIYLLKVTGITALLLLYYHIALRNKRFHYYNRFYLLFTVVTSIVLPLLQLQWFILKNDLPQSLRLLKIISSSSGGEEVTITGNGTANLQQIILYFLAAASIFLLLILCFRLTRIYRLKQKFPVQHFEEFDFINTDISSAPFSFLKNIFWRNDIHIDDETGTQVLQHEIIHVKQKHSWDKLFMQFILCFYWMNPFYYLLKKELYLIHEFIADENAVKQSDATAFTKMLLTAQFGKFNYLPAQSIFYSPIKRRLIMLTTSKKTHLSYLRRITALPLIIVVACLFAFTEKKQVTNSSIQKITAAQPFVLVVDAGHGGKDYGAAGNGLYEKDIALKIAQKIKSLSNQYNMDVVLTRSTDIFMTPAEKSNFANKQNANAFISIHVNAISNNQPQQSGFEVVISKDNAQEFSSALLGSAIIQNLQADFNTKPALQEKKVGIWILKNSIIPCTLIECGYITNANDVKLLKDDAKIELIARKILSGAAMFANNKSSITPENIIDRNGDTTTPLNKENTESTQVNIKTTGAETPLYIVDGIEMKSPDLNSTLQTDDILSINVWKGDTAIAKFGEKGKNGVIEITSKKNKKKESSATFFAPPVIVKDEQPADNSLKPVFTNAETPPQFPGGNEAWNYFLNTNINTDFLKKQKAPAGKYTVTISFIINDEGNITDVKAINNPGYSIVNNAIHIIKSSPKWIPAVQNGYNVSFQREQSITFKVD